MYRKEVSLYGTLKDIIGQVDSSALASENRIHRIFMLDISLNNMEQSD